MQELAIQDTNRRFWTAVVVPTDAQLYVKQFGSHIGTSILLYTYAQCVGAARLPLAILIPRERCSASRLPPSFRRIDHVLIGVDEKYMLHSIFWKLVDFSLNCA